jgi:hypothetical protein
LLSAEDLSRPGWAFEVPARAGGACVANSRVVPHAEVTGVLTLRPRVFPEELAHVASADRAYVAAEMTAILLAWLVTRRCPVINPPSARSLAGPDWPASRWRHEAAHLGIPLAPADASCAPAPIEIVFTCGRLFGAENARLGEHVAALARTARCEALACGFTGTDQFISATPWPALVAPPVRDALGRALGGRA